MKIARILILLFVSLTLISPSRTFSQIIIPSDYNSWAIGAKFGMLPFYGDVRMLKYTPDNKYRKTNTGFAFEGIKNLNHIFGIRADVLLAGLSGSSINLNKHFIAGIKEFSVSGIVNLNDLISFYPEREKVINAYIFAGIGLMNFRSKVYSYDENAYITGYGWDSTGLGKTAGTNETTFPIGFGIKYKADTKIDIGLEYTLHLTNTDKLDAWVVDKSYMDRFGYAAVSITYKIGNKKEYVDWVNPFQDTTNVFASNANQVVENVTASNTSSVKQNTNTSTTKTNKDTSTTANQTKTNNQTTTNNQITANNQTSTNNTQTTVVAEENYFIVSSAYKTKKLAKEAVVKLKSKGYQNAMILGESSSGSWRVSLKGYTTMEDAIAEISGIKKTYQYAKLFEKKGEKDFVEISSKIISKLLIAQVDTSKTTKTNTNQTVVTNNTKTNTTTTANTTTSNQNTTTANTNNTNNATTTNTANTNTTTNNTSNTNTNNTTNTTTQNTTTAVNNTNTSTTQSNNTTTTATVVKKFYIIAASYPTEQQANDAVAALKAKGFANAEVVGKNDLGSYRICYKGYATRAEANVDLPGIKQSTNPSAWIFEKK